MAMTKGKAKATGKAKPTPMPSKTRPPATKAPALKKSRPGIKIKSKDEKKNIQDKHTGRTLDPGVHIYTPHQIKSKDAEKNIQGSHAGHECTRMEKQLPSA
jgi:hypothetical protein